ncbi:phage baseplate assembly protein [Novosphingobium naphthalenivorans]|uniref:phage baseplate assembly protein n=1 Tax=Novosphingobium naphthalenivorans TaxID=273168 RepID=UPI0008310F7F|nr:contractile injection system protein, VgrG/Pvc8 family [Novosphingobium naphthalenivorans]
MSVLPHHEVALEIGGLGYFGWTEITVERAIDAMVGSFDLSLSTKDRTGAEDWPIEDGATCRVLLGGEVLITGYIDAVTRFIDPERRGIRVRGRDKTMDLVDCSAINKPGSWTGQKLEAIAKALAAPFGVSIEVSGDTGAAFKKFALQQGESAFAAIERMARYRGLVAYSPGDGTVRIGSADTGVRTGRIEEGVNVKSAEATSDMSGRYSQYVVKGQASGDNSRHGKTVSQVKGEAADSEVTRYRPLLVIGEEQSDTASLVKRAKWEAAVRSGRGKPLSVTVPGWLTDEGKVWAPGARAACKIPSCKVDGDLLVESVRTTRNGREGSMTELRLVPPEAWTQLPEPEESAS